MKRMIALVVSLIFILTLAMPVAGNGAEMDKELENAIKIAKAKFSVPDDYKFSSSISMNGTKKVYYLNWRSADKSQSTNISATVDENGSIIGYNKYVSSDYVKTSKLPKLSRQDARVKADGYIEWIEKGLVQKLRYEESTQASLYDTSYYLTYYRVENGVPFYRDRVTVTVNRNTGELQDYSKQWTDKVDLPAVKNVISVNKAGEAYMKNMGLKLIYKYSNTDDVLKAYAVYVPVYNNSNYGVDAFTGARKRLSVNDYYNDYGSADLNFSKAKDTGKADGEVSLSPEEQKAVEEASQIISRDEAEKIARSSKFLNISGDAKLQNYYLNPNWPDKTEYRWSLSFNKPAGESSAYEEYTSVTINAKTGVITSFYRNSPYMDGAKPKSDLAAAKIQVDAFLAEYYPQYYKQVEYDRLTSESDNSGSGKSTNYNFVYSRMVNGIAFPDNGINIYYDNLNGVISNFSLDWFNLSFPSIDKVIGLDKAGEVLIDKVGLELQYNYEYVSNADRMNEAENAAMLLVYMLNSGKPLIIDANTGNLLNYDGSAYKEPVKVSYTDIKGNAAEKQIMVLAENGVYLDGTEFKPGTAIIQKDFMTLLAKTLNYYGAYVTGKDIDELYQYLQREGIVKEGEKAPNSTVTREEAVKFLIRALKYDKVADIKGIFNVSFKDKDKISTGLTGYVAIASGLGIIDSKSTSFNPKSKITRGDTAIMIYNYLQS